MLLTELLVAMDRLIGKKTVNANQSGQRVGTNTFCWADCLILSQTYRAV